tara:strand:+ start:130 stop:432 length:303 start_codon:yes stop_codon:yes gene_type:complete
MAKRIKRELFDPPNIEDTPKWFQKATKGIFAKDKPKSKPKSPPRDPYIPETPEAWAVEGSTLDKPSKEWADWVDKEGKAAGFRGAKSPKKIAKKPYKRNK